VYACAVEMLTSMVVIVVCMLSASVGQNVTLVTPAETSASSVNDSFITNAVTTTVSATVSTTVSTTVVSSSPSVFSLMPTMTHGSPLNLSVVLDIRSNFELSFRTCSHGSLLSQTGDDDRKYFSLVLDDIGSLNISWSSVATSQSVLLWKDLNDNRWYKLVWTNDDLGNITVSVQQNMTVLHETTFSNTSDNSLWNVNLQNGSKLNIGDGWFEGCLRDGPQLWFSSAAEVDARAVQWDSCPNRTACDRSNDSCSSAPCTNNGRFDIDLSYLCTAKTVVIMLQKFSV